MTEQDDLPSREEMLAAILAIQVMIEESLANNFVNDEYRKGIIDGMIIAEALFSGAEEVVFPSHQEDEEFIEVLLSLSRTEVDPSKMN